MNLFPMLMCLSIFRFGTDRLRKVRVLLDRKIVDKYFNEDDEDSELEKAKKEKIEKERLRKKRLYHQRMKKKKQQAGQNQGYLGQYNTITTPYNKAGKIDRKPMPKVRPPPKVRQNPLPQKSTEVIDLDSDNDDEGDKNNSNGQLPVFYVTWDKASEHFDFDPENTSQNNNFTCKLCSGLQTRRDKALKHYREVHLEADYVFICTFCTPEKKFDTRSNLYNHLRGSKHHYDVKEKDIDGTFMRKRADYVEIKPEPKERIRAPRIRPKVGPKSSKPKMGPKSVTKNGKKVNGNIYQVALVDSSDDDNENGEEEEEDEDSDEDNYYVDDSDSPIEIIMPSIFSSKKRDQPSVKTAKNSNGLPHSSRPTPKVQKSPEASDVEEITLDD